MVLREMRRIISAKRAHVCNKRSKHFLREVFLFIFFHIDIIVKFESMREAHEKN